LATDTFSGRIGAVVLLVCALAALHPARMGAQMIPREAPGTPVPANASVAPDTGDADDAPGAKFLAVGAGVGTPAGISFTAGGYLAPLFLGVSGGYWGTRWNGFQGDIGVLFNSSPGFAHGISVVGGVFRANPVIANAGGAAKETDRIVHYVGAAYDAYLSGFYLQIGLAHGRGDYPNPQLLMQFGYLFAF